jgi:hypothetical protein
MKKKENIEEEAAWKTKMRKDFKKYPIYADFMKQNRPLSYEQWKFHGLLIREKTLASLGLK